MIGGIYNVIFWLDVGSKSNDVMSGCFDGCVDTTHAIFGVVEKTEYGIRVRSLSSESKTHV